MPQIKLFTGQLIEITEPESEVQKISPKDLAICLDRVIRFNGAHPGDISVAEHSLNTQSFAKHYLESDRMQLICLLHDAAEAVLSDIPSPVKRLLSTEFFELEKRWEMAMYYQFGSIIPHDHELLNMKKYDDMAFVYEVGQWATQDQWNFNDDTYDYVSEFLDRLHKLNELL